MEPDVKFVERELAIYLSYFEQKKIETIFFGEFNMSKAITI